MSGVNPRCLRVHFPVNRLDLETRSSVPKGRRCGVDIQQEPSPRSSQVFTHLIGYYSSINSMGTHDEMHEWRANGTAADHDMSVLVKVQSPIAWAPCHTPSRFRQA